jgi:hypothetical protein
MSYGSTHGSIGPRAIRARFAHRKLSCALATSSSTPRSIASSCSPTVSALAGSATGFACLASSPAAHRRFDGSGNSTTTRFSATRSAAPLRLAAWIAGAAFVARSRAASPTDRADSCGMRGSPKRSAMRYPSISSLSITAHRTCTAHSGPHIRRPLRLHGFMRTLIASTASTRRPSAASADARRCPDLPGPLPAPLPVNMARPRSIRAARVHPEAAPGSSSSVCRAQEARASG